MSQAVALLYLSDAAYGGWHTFTVHLFKAFQSIGKKPRLFKVTRQGEKFLRDFGCGLQYQNVPLNSLLSFSGKIILVAVGKKFRPLACSLLEAGAAIVIHDPTEYKQADFYSVLKELPGGRLVLVRSSGKESLPNGEVIYHPYVRSFGDCAGDRPKWAVSVSRVDFDKHTDVLLEANRKLAASQRIDIFGSANPMYVFHKLSKAYPEYKETSFPRVFNAAARLCRGYRYMVDMSAISGDGGGTQYTFLEAMDAGAICVLNSKWFSCPGEMQAGENCLSAKDASSLVEVLSSDPSEHVPLIAAAQHVLDTHAPGKVARQYCDVLGL